MVFFAKRVKYDSQAMEVDNGNKRRARTYTGSREWVQGSPVGLVQKYLQQGRQREQSPM